jgi:hypothetical protein
MSFHERAHARAPWRRLPGLQVAGVSERPTGVDERVAAIFRDMRVGLGVSTADLAHALGTTVAVIETLESGRVRAFPAWPETVRIVSELGKLHHVDTRPILARIRDQVGPAGLGQVPKTAPVTRAPVEKHPLLRVRDRARAARREAWRDGAQHARRQVRRAARALFAISTPVALFGGVLWLAQTQPALISRGVAKLPEPVARVVRPAAEYVVIQMAPRREGMRWIEVADPRSRKSDKLRQASR